MKKVSIFLAKGFEEVEALTVVDLLIRAGAEVTMVSIGETRDVESTHGVVIRADKVFADMDFSDMDMLVLPGGLPGTTNLKECGPLIKLLQDYNAKGGLIAAICAAPSVLGKAGLLKGKKATCYPGVESQLTGAETVKEPVVVDGNITTSRGVGTAIDFALTLIDHLYGADKAKEISDSIVYKM